MSITKVLYKGPTNDQVNENLTINSVYLAKPSRIGFLTVLDDTATLVEMPAGYFALPISQPINEQLTEVTV